LPLLNGKKREAQRPSSRSFFYHVFIELFSRELYHTLIAPIQMDALASDVQYWPAACHSAMRSMFALHSDAYRGTNINNNQSLQGLNKQT